MRILVPTAAVMSLLWLGCAGPAQAHAHLKTATPAADSTVAASPAELRLTFTEDLELKFSGVAVKGPGKAVVRTGARVDRGQLVGLSGETGLATGCHLHFEVYENGTPVDPMTWLT